MLRRVGDAVDDRQQVRLVRPRTGTGRREAACLQHVCDTTPVHEVAPGTRRASSGCNPASVDASGGRGEPEADAIPLSRFAQLSV